MLAVEEDHRLSLTRPRGVQGEDVPGAEVGEEVATLERREPGPPVDVASDDRAPDPRGVHSDRPHHALRLAPLRRREALGPLHHVPPEVEAAPPARPDHVDLLLLSLSHVTDPQVTG